MIQTKGPISSLCWLKAGCGKHAGPVAALVIIAFLLSVGARPTVAQCTLGGSPTTWTDGNSNWNNGANWSTGTVPNSSAINVCIADGTSTVTLDARVSVASFQLASGNALNINPGQILNVSGPQLTNAGAITIGDGGAINAVGTILNQGTITIAATSTSVSSSTNLNITNGHSATLTGGGTVMLSSSGGGTATMAGFTSTLTNMDNTIEGSGNVGNGQLTLFNSGTIKANASGTLTLSTSSDTNTGSLLATSGGTLSIQSSIINQNGLIQSSSGSSVLIGNNATISGGTLDANGGTLGTNGNITLNGSVPGGLTIKGTFTVNDGNTANILGSIQNQGTISVIDTGDGASLSLSGDVTLTGHGTVTLSSSSTNTAYIQSSGSGPTLTNVDNLIQGSGNIGGNFGMSVINQGTINATAGTLSITTSSFTNANLLEASAGGTLSIQSNINNGGGTISSSGGSSVLIGNGATIYGGTLNSGGGTLGTAGSITLDGGATNGPLTIAGTFTVNNGDGVALNTGTIINTGTIDIAAGNSNTSLFPAQNATVTLTGGGNVVLSTTGSGTAFLEGFLGTLTNVDNTIEGVGTIGSSNHHLTLTNEGTINANIASGTLNVSTAATTNTGLIEATNGGILAIPGTVIDNQGGTILSNGTGTLNGGTVVASSVVLNQNNAVIQGGTLNTINGGTMGSAGGVTVTLDGSTHGALTNLGTFTVANSSGVSLTGTIINSGTIDIAAGNSNTSLFPAQNATVTLTGGGNVVLSTTGSGTAFLEGFLGTLTNVDNTIEGVGTIGSGNHHLALTNEGTINANVTSGTLVVSTASLSNTGLMEATGAGTLSIQNNVNNTGGTILAKDVVSTVQFAGTPTITGGFINGIGTLSGDFTLANGTIAPGLLTSNSPGTLMVNGNFTQSGGAFNEIISSTSNYGILSVNGNATLSSGLATTLNITLANGFTPQTGDSFTILNATSLTGQFSNGSTFIRDGYFWTLTYGSTDAVLSIGASASGTAVTATWTSGSGNWTTAANWSCSSGPSSCVPNETFTNVYNAVLNSSGNTMTLSSTDSPSSIVLNDLNVQAGRLLVTGGAGLTVTGNTRVIDTIQVEGGSTADLGTLANLSAGVLTGGTYEAGGGGTAGVINVNGNVSTIASGAEIFLDQFGSKLTNVSADALAGLTSINGGGLTLFDGASETITSGSGTFTNNGGTVNASFGGSSLTVNGNFSNTNGNSLGVTVNGTGGGAFLNVAGNFTNDSATGTTMVTVENGGALNITGAGNSFTNQNGAQLLVNTLGTVNVAGDFTNEGGSQVALQSGGRLGVSGNFVNESSGSVQVNGASLSVNGNLTNQGLAGMVVQNGGSLSVTGASGVTNSSNMFIGSTSGETANSSLTVANAFQNLGTLQLAATVGTTTTQATVGSFNNSGNVAILTGTTLTSTGAYTQTAGGATTVEGTLQGTGGVNINGGTLQGAAGIVAGSGTINGPVTIGSGGTLMAGLSPTSSGTLNFGGALDINNGTLTEVINSGTAGSGYGVLNITGTLTLGAGSKLDILSTYDPAAGTILTIATTGSSTAGLTFGTIENDTFTGPSGAEKWVVLDVGNNLELQAETVAATEVTATWSAGSGNWNTATQWSCSPGSSSCMPNNSSSNVYEVTLNSPGQTLTLDNSVASGNISVNSLALTAGTLNIASGATLNLVNQPGGITDINANTGLIVGGTFEVTNGATTTSALAGLTSVAGTLTLQGQNITTTPSGAPATFSNTGTVNLQQGTAFTVQGDLTNSGTVTTGNGASDTGSNALAVSGTLTNSGTFALNAARDSVAAGTLTNSGGISLNAANQSVTVAGAFNNNSGGSLTLNSAASNSTLSVGGAFTNSSGASVTMAGAGDKLNASGAFSNAGSTTVGNSETLNANGGYTNTGTTDVTGTLNTTTYQHNGGTTTIESGGTISAASFTQTGGSVQGIGAIAGAYALSGGTFTPGSLSTPGTLTINGSFAQTGGTFNELMNGTSNGILNVTGAVSLSGATLDILGSYDPAAGTILTIATTGSSTAGLTFGTIENDTFTGPSGAEKWVVIDSGNNIELEAENVGPTRATWSTGSGNWNTATQWSCSQGTATCVPNNSSGTVYDVALNSPGQTLTLDNSVASGNISVNSLALTAGTLNIASGATLNLVNQPGGITDINANSGLIVGGTFEVTNGATTTNALAGLTSVEGTLTLANGQATTATPAGGTLAVNGAGIVNANQASTLNVVGSMTNSGAITTGSDGSGSNAIVVAGALTNSGTINLNGATAFAPIGNSLSAASIANSGTINMTGSNYVASSLNSTGDFNNNAGGTVTAAGQIAVGGNFNNAGGASLTVNTVGLTGASNVAVSGTFANGGAVDVAGNSSLNAAGYHQNGGSTTVGGGTIFGVTPGTITVTNYVQSGGTTTIESGASTYAFAIPGVINATNFSQTGGTTIIEGEPVANGGIPTGPNPTSISTTNFTQSGGSVEGTGTIAGAYVMSGGSITPGFSATSTPGTLTINGSFAQSGGTFNEMIGTGSNYGILSVTGAVNLSSGAALNITLGSGFSPVDGEQFTFLSGGSLTGQFSNPGSFVQDGFDWTLTYGTNDAILTLVSAAGGGGGTPSNVTATWATTSDGNWNTAAVWSCTPGPSTCVPNNSVATAYDAVLNSAGHTLTLDNSPGAVTVNTLTVQAGTLSLSSGASLTASSITNSGAITLGSGLFVGSSASLTSTGDFTNNSGGSLAATSGTVTVGGNFNNASGASLVLGSGGFGFSSATVSVNDTLFNAGTVTLSGTGDTLTVGTLSNTGQVSVGADESLTALAAFNNNSGGSLTVSGGTVLIGEFNNASGASVVLGSSGFGFSSTMVSVNDTLTNSGTVTLSGTGDTLTAGSLSNTGQISVGAGESLTSNGEAFNNAGGVITVTGGSVTVGQNLFNASGASLVLNSGGSVSVAESLVNGGTVTVNTGTLTAGSVENSGTVSLVLTQFGFASSNLTSAGDFNNDAGGALSITGGGVQVGGNFNNASGASLTLDSSSGFAASTVAVAGAFNNQGGAVTVGAGSTLSAGSGYVNTGSTTVNGALNVTGMYSNSGTTIVNGSLTASTEYLQTAGTTGVGGTLTTPLYRQTGGATVILNSATGFAPPGGPSTDFIQTGGSVEGVGGIVGAYSMSGSSTITPGLSAGSTPGSLFITGSYAQAGGTFNEMISSASSYGVLNVSGTASLSSAAALHIATAPGFVPTAGSSFAILNAGSLSGTFATASAGGATWNPNGVDFTLDNYVWNLTYSNTGASLNVVSDIANLSQVSDTLLVSDGKTSTIAPPGSTFTVGPSGNLKVQQSSTLNVNNTLVNSGNVSIDQGSALNVGGDTTNVGIITVQGGSTLTLGGNLNNSGTLNAGGSGAGTVVVNTINNSGTFNVGGSSAGTMVCGTPGSGCTINSDGSFTVSLSGTLSGPFQVKVEGGSYKEELNAAVRVTNMTIEELQNAGDSIPPLLPVTPLSAFKASVTLDHGATLITPSFTQYNGLVQGGGLIDVVYDMDNGVIVPGFIDTGTPDTLTLDGTFNMNGGILAELIAPNANGLLDVTGAANLGDAAALEIFFESGFQPVDGEQFDIMNYGTLTGEFLNAPGDGTFTMDGWNWDINYGFDGNEVLLTAESPEVVSTPEPSALLLLATGLLALAVLYRRKRAWTAR